MAAASREFQVMVKPVGALCNLDCSYCYYLEKKELYPNRESFRMPPDLLERYIVQHIEAAPKTTILFSWHGGEPTLLGVDYFRHMVELQEKHRPAGREILNGIQTNGMLIDEEWCRFLGANRFHVGLSIDGPRELHDEGRRTVRGEATHKRVMQTFRLLQNHRVSTDVLCVVHRANVGQPAALYRFFRDAGVKFLQFLPLVRRERDGAVGADAVPPDAYRSFLCAVFDEWSRQDVGRITIQNFEEAMRPYLGQEHALCIHRETCGDIVVLEHNGDFYTCDHFVDPQHRIGNIRDTPLVELLEHPAVTGFGRDKSERLPGECRRCEVLSSCNGGCPKDRFATSSDGEAGLNYLCAGYKSFFLHSRPWFTRVAGLMRSGVPVERLLENLREQDRPLATRVGRNDPCPCGSGRKYKKCCLEKAV